MKKFKLIEEVGWMLTEDSRRDKNLNAVDKNMLAILQFIEDGKSAHGEWFRILIKHPNGKWNDDNYNSIEKYFSEFEVPTPYCTLNRSVNKLLRLGYIDYKTGWYNNTTHQGMTPMIKLLKGTIPIKYSDIATAKGNDDIESSEKLTTDKSATCNDIAIAYEKEKEKENNKHTYNLSTIEQIENTYSISDSKGDKNRPDWALDNEDMVTPKPTVADIYGLEFSNLIHQYWIDNDSLPLCDYYRQHPTDDISTAIEKALNSSDLQCFENFKNSLNNTNIRSLYY